jgi:DNA-binding response OmpR family regulator
MAKVLLIERGRRTNPSFATALKDKGYNVTTTDKVKTALQVIKEVSPDIVVLDAASMDTSGERMCRILRQTLNGTPIILIAPEDSEPAVNGQVNSLLIQPFTARKLTNRVARLIPGDDRDEVRAGPICLNLAKRVVKVRGKLTRLTPQAATLLELFLRRPGELLKREDLMRRVWQTDYMGDTRTLDVHISWLRKAIELNPRSPRLLRTIRGVGYRLELTPSRPARGD